MSPCKRTTVVGCSDNVVEGKRKEEKEKSHLRSHFTTHLKKNKRGLVPTAKLGSWEVIPTSQLGNRCRSADTKKACDFSTLYREDSSNPQMKKPWLGAGSAQKCNRNIQLAYKESHTYESCWCVVWLVRTLSDHHGDDSKLSPNYDEKDMLMGE